MHYITQAMRTNSTEVGSTNLSPDLIHAALGLADELFELQQAVSREDHLNYCEEAGDMCWFIALAAHALDHDPFHTSLYLDVNNAASLPELVNQFISAVKKSYAYGKPLDSTRLCRTLDALVAGMRTACNVMAQELGTPTFDTILEANIAKLQTRFPERFDMNHALSRNTAAEMAAIGAQLQ